MQMMLARASESTSNAEMVCGLLAVLLTFYLVKSMFD
jgi:hypothetical protein